MKKIKAFIVNRNLVSTLKDTIDFLLAEPRVETIILDQDSSYPPLLEYYKNCGARVIYNKSNDGPYSVWKLKDEFNNEPFIVTDSDCNYNDIPSDWLDIMLDCLKRHQKVGFSLKIDDLPDNELTEQVKHWENRFWQNKCPDGWIAHVDTTFALYRAKSEFLYESIRLDHPYTIKHIPWYIDKENVPEEWKYYIEHTSSISYWGTRMKSYLR